MQTTFDRLAKHFFWVGMRKFVVNYCRTCDTCQRLGKANIQRQAPLINLPVIGEIFSKLAIDIVGPLKTCQSGSREPIHFDCNRFHVTLMTSHVTRHFHVTLAYPLKSHTAMYVLKCLVEVFSQPGFLTSYFLK